MASVNVSTSTHAANIPSGFKNDVIRAIRHKCILQKTINMDWSWDKSLGQTIHVNRTVNWEKQVKTPDSNIVATAYKPTEETLYIDTFEYSAAQIEDFAKLFIADAVLTDIKNSQAYVLNRGVETAISNLYQSFSQTITGTAYNSEVTWAQLVKGAELLITAGIDVDTETVHLVISPQQSSVFKQMNQFMDANLGGSSKEYDKAVLARDKVLGATIVSSNLLRAPGAGGHDMALYYRDAIALVFAQKPTWFEDWRGLALGTLCGFRQAYGLKRSYRHAETPGSTSLTDNWAVSIPGV